MRLLPRVLPAIALIAVLCFGGCTTTDSTAPQGGAAGGSPAQAPPPARLLGPDEAFSSTRVFTRDGAESSWEDVVDRAGRAEVIVIAEQHGQPVGLSAAAALWRRVLAARGPAGSPQPVLLLEFFERDHQQALDQFAAGAITEQEFLTRTGKATAETAPDPWQTGYPPGHRDMVNSALTAKPPVRVVAANAPRRLVRLARTDGYDAVRTSTGGRRLAELPRFADDPPSCNPPDSRYWRDFLSFLGTTPEQFARAEEPARERSLAMFRAQSVWDATMASSVREALQAGHRPVVLVVGQFHTDFASTDNTGGGGLIQEILAWRPSTRLLTVSFQAGRSWQEQDRGRADAVVFDSPKPSPGEPSTSR